MEALKLGLFAKDAPAADPTPASPFRTRRNRIRSLFRRHRANVSLSRRAKLYPTLSTATSGTHPAYNSEGIKDEAAKFAETAKSANLVALSQSVFCDHLTPVLAYRCLVKEDEIDAPSFLFESVNKGPVGLTVVSQTQPNHCEP